MPSSDIPNLETNYETAENVRARFGIYPYYRSEFDPEVFEMATASMLRFHQIRTVYELGSGDGTFLDLLNDYAQASTDKSWPRQVGFEPNKTQRQLEQVDNRDAKLLESLASHGIHIEPPARKRRPLIVGSGAEAIEAVEEGSVDCLLAFYMLYHLDQQKQQEVLENSARILSPNGIFIATTSSEDNKHGHRLIESIVAKSLGIQPPQFMNTSFTSERGALLLPRHFDEVYRADITGELQKDGYEDDDRKLEVIRRYIQSQLSLADQYTPTQHKYDSEFVRTVGKTVIREFMNPNFKDSMHRTMFICSNAPLDNSPFIDIPRSDLDFQRIS